MTKIQTLAVLAVLCVLGGSAPLFATEAQSVRIELQRDPVLEQNLRYLASADTAITPARVLRWIDSLMGNTPKPSTSSFEFQPVVRAHDNREQLIAQIAYKF